MRVADNPAVTAAVIVGRNSRQRLIRPLGEPAVEMAAFGSVAVSDPVVEMAGFESGVLSDPAVEMGSFASAT